jgi:hypothetical protein
VSPQAIQYSGEHLDLGPRYVFSTTVAASPALAAETIIATLPQLGDLAISKGVVLDGWAAFTVGTSGTAIRLRIRRTDVNGTVVADTGALTGGVAAAALVAQDVCGVDTGATLPGQVYVLTLQVTAGAAASTVSAVKLDCLAI